LAILAGKLRKRIKDYVDKAFEREDKQSIDLHINACKKYDTYLNVCDDFKTNLLWLSIFVPTIEGVGMRISVNYRSVLQSNYFDQVDNKKSIFQAAYETDGDTFQNSPLKLVFYAAIHTGKEALLSNMKLTSISKVNIDATAASLPVSLRFICVDSIDSINTKIIVLIILVFSFFQPIETGVYSNMILENERIHCAWPGQEQLENFLFVLGYHPYKNVYDSLGKHDFPWKTILSLFNDKDMSDSEAVKSILTDLNFDFMYDDSLTSAQNLSQFKSFYQCLSPISGSALEGGHRIELSNRLLYGFMLKQEAPFQRTQDAFEHLPFDSTVYKPISASVYLPSQDYPDLSFSVISHLKVLSRKTANQKELYIKDSWRSLYESIYSAIDGDQDLLGLLYSTQKDLYEAALKPRPNLKHQASLSRKGLKNIITEVVFTENPTSYLALNNSPKPVSKELWQAKIGKSWDLMDSNPYSNVS
jgi:hypothetical protein